MQLNLTFQELLEKNIIHYNIFPRNIYIKYTNRKKTNFDSILTVCGYYINYSKDKDQSFLCKTFIGTPIYQVPEVLCGRVTNNSDLFSIEMTIYFLYFNEIAYLYLDKLDSNEKELSFKCQIEEDRQLEDLLKKLLKKIPIKELIGKNIFLIHFSYNTSIKKYF